MSEDAPKSRDRLTMRETCEALGVSRAFVRKLDATGELKGVREGGRVLFDRAAVEAYRTARDVAKVQRVQNAEDRELDELSSEADQHDLELTAWLKSQEERREREKLDESLTLMRKELREMREAEERRQQDAAFYRRHERRPKESDSELVDLITMFAPAAAMLLAAYLVRDRTSQPVPPLATAEMRSPTTPSEAPSTAAASAVEAPEEEILEKIKNGTAAKEDLDALAALWRRRRDQRAR
jgi:excisionase family DNA binding protein